MHGQRYAYLSDILEQARDVGVAGDEVGEGDGQNVQVDPQRLAHLRVESDLLKRHNMRIALAVVREWRLWIMMVVCCMNVIRRDRTTKS